MKFDSLPTEIQSSLLYFLNEQELTSLAQTNKFSCELVSSSKQWIHLAHYYYGSLEHLTVETAIRLLKDYYLSSNDVIIFDKIQTMLDSHSRTLHAKNHVRFDILMNDPISRITHTFMVRTYPKKSLSIEIKPSTTLERDPNQIIVERLQVPFDFPERLGVSLAASSLGQKPDELEIVHGLFKATIRTNLNYIPKRTQLSALLERQLTMLSSEQDLSFFGKIRRLFK